MKLARPTPKVKVRPLCEVWLTTYYNNSPYHTTLPYYSHVRPLREQEKYYIPDLLAWSLDLSCSLNRPPPVPSCKPKAGAPTEVRDGHVAQISRGARENFDHFEDRHVDFRGKIDAKRKLAGAINGPPAVPSCSLSITCGQNRSRSLNGRFS